MALQRDRIAEELEFQASDDYPIKCQHHAAMAQPKAIIACLHGIQSHAGWYDRSCTLYAERGYEVYFMDRRGSGRNEIDRGHCRHRSVLCDDVERFIAFTRTRHPALPAILLGISWGGKLAVATIKDRPKLVDGLAFLCPGWFSKVSPTFREQLAIGWSTFLWPRRKIRIPLSDPALFTSNPDGQEYIRNDKLGLRKATARLLFQSRMLDLEIKMAPNSIRIPSLLVLTGHDRIIRNEPTRAYFDRFASEHKEVLEFADCHHTIEFEEDPTAPLEAIADGLDRLLKAIRT